MFKQLWFCWARLKYRLRTRYVELFHHDSPGKRVYVRRTWWQRKLYPESFSIVGEKMYPFHLVPQVDLHRPLGVNPIYNEQGTP